MSVYREWLQLDATGPLATYEMGRLRVPHCTSRALAILSNLASLDVLTRSYPQDPLETVRKVTLIDVPRR